MILPGYNSFTRDTNLSQFGYYYSLLILHLYCQGLHSPHEHVARLATVASPTNVRNTGSLYKYCSSYFLKVTQVCSFVLSAVGVTVLCFIANVYLGSQHEQTDRAADEEYLDHLLHLRHAPHPPLPQRKLSNVLTRGMPRHVELYDLQVPPPEDHTYNCVLAKTTPQFHICVYPSYMDKYISAAILSGGIWEPYITPIVQKALNKYPDTVFIDIGANIGYYTLLAAKMGHHVIAVEPAYENIIRLHKGITLNKLQHNIQLVFNAVSDSHENVTLTGNKDNQGGIWIRKISKEQQQQLLSRPAHKVVMTTTMDHLLEVTYFSEAVIKIDIGMYGQLISH